MPPDAVAEIKRNAAKQTPVWIPNPGPQTAAKETLADELYYGGSAGAGKSSLVVGLAITEHRRSIIFRREYPQIKGLEDEAQRILGSRDGYNAQDKFWRLPLPGNPILEFGSCQHEKDVEKYQGRPHDFIAFDEIPQFSEGQYRFLIGWNRTTRPNQRCRIVAAGNPPLTAEGLWVIKYWGAWLDPTHPNPARPGELRWYTTINGVDQEVDGPGPHLVNGREIMARSRTFIPGRLEDNPDLMRTGYASVLESMPETLRAALRDGNFQATLKDDAFQVIPTAWIVAAQNRWKPDGWKDVTMTAMAFDPAGGGKDAAELVWRHGGWYSEFVSERGEQTADGSSAAATIIRYRRDNAPVIVDVGGGYGGAVTLRLKDNQIPHSGFNGAAKSTLKTKDGQLHFANNAPRRGGNFAKNWIPINTAAASSHCPRIRN